MPSFCALITGASSGIGEALAETFARHRTNVLLVARSERVLADLARRLEKQYTVEAVALPADLADPSTVPDIQREVEERGLVVEYLVNNAGFGDYGPFSEADWEKTRAMIEVNIMALTHLTRAFLPGMVKRGHGCVLNIASTAAFQPGPLMSVYYASKAYVLHFTEAIANELQGTGVTATAHCPGPVKTRFQERAHIQQSRPLRGRWLPTPMQVAEDAYQAMMNGKAVKVHGLMNSIVALASRFAPRDLVVRAVRFIQEKRR